MRRCGVPCLGTATAAVQRAAHPHATHTKGCWVAHRQRTRKPRGTPSMIDWPRLFDRMSFTPSVAAALAGDPKATAASRQVHRECLREELHTPFAHHIGQEGNAGTEDVGQPRDLQSDLVGFGDHLGIGNHGHIGEQIGGLGRESHTYPALSFCLLG
jgi:hypothetical protein